MFLDDTVKALKDKYTFTLDTIEGVSHKECLKHKKDCTVFWEKVTPYSEAYGNSAIEAGMYGIPTVVYLSERARNQARGALKDMPFINAEPGVESCTKTLDTLLGATVSDLRDLSKRTKEWVDKTHSYEAVGKQYVDIYDRLLT